jgi:hypothetical protein
MNHLMALLLAVVMGVHSFAGCCMHHAHAGESSPVAACTHQQGHCHAIDSDGDEHSSPSPHSRPCAEQECVFVRSDAGAVVDAMTLRAVNQALVLIDCLGGNPLTGFYLAHLRESDFAPPARLHLLNQILLI